MARNDRPRRWALVLASGLLVPALGTVAGAWQDPAPENAPTPGETKQVVKKKRANDPGRPEYSLATKRVTLAYDVQRKGDNAVHVVFNADDSDKTVVLRSNASGGVAFSKISTRFTLKVNDGLNVEVAVPSVALSNTPNLTDNEPCEYAIKGAFFEKFASQLIRALLDAGYQIERGPYQLEKASLKLRAEIDADSGRSVEREAAGDLTVGLKFKAKDAEPVAAPPPDGAGGAVPPPAGAVPPPAGAVPPPGGPPPPTGEQFNRLNAIVRSLSSRLKRAEEALDQAQKASQAKCPSASLPDRCPRCGALASSGAFLCLTRAETVPAPVGPRFEIAPPHRDTPGALEPLPMSTEPDLPSPSADVPLPPLMMRDHIRR